jgi:hypothetical protein
MNLKHLIEGVSASAVDRPRTISSQTLHCTLTGSRHTVPILACQLALRNHGKIALVQVHTSQAVSSSGLAPLHGVSGGVSDE